MRPQDHDNEKAGDNEIKRLIEERRGIAKGDQQQLKEVSKKIKKCIRDKKDQVTSRKGIANVFGEFYSELYAEERFDEEKHDPHWAETRTSKRGRIDKEEGKNEKEIPVFTKMTCTLPSTASKEAKQATAMESVLRTSRHVTRRKKR